MSVRKYDAHTYYKGLSGAGLKGADFVALYKRERLVIIEVKTTFPPFFHFIPEKARFISGW